MLVLRGVLRGEHNRAAALVDLAKGLGQPVPSSPSSELVDVLRPKRAEEARTRSLSASHGLGPFPFHTDAAHWSVPSRFVLLCCDEPEPSPTAVKRFPENLSKSDSELVRRAVFRFSGGAQGFYSSILDSTRPFIRFDEGCMVPASALAKEALAIVRARLDRSASLEHRWEVGDVLVIDNWSVLHARTGEQSSPLRKLLRIQVRQ